MRSNYFNNFVFGQYYKMNSKDHEKIDDPDLGDLRYKIERLFAELTEEQQKLLNSVLLGMEDKEDYNCDSSFLYGLKVGLLSGIELASEDYGLFE